MLPIRLKALSRVFPAELPFHPGWKQNIASPIYWTHSTSLEHVIPIARGGADGESNFATSCYGCNDARKELLLEELGWNLLPTRADSTWAGLREYLPSLRRLASKTTPAAPLPSRVEPVEQTEIGVGMLIRARCAATKRRATFRVEALDAIRGALLREMWTSAGAWVESNGAAWSEVEGEVEVERSPPVGQLPPLPLAR